MAVAFLILVWYLRVLIGIIYTRAGPIAPLFKKRGHPIVGLIKVSEKLSTYCSSNRNFVRLDVFSPIMVFTLVGHGIGAIAKRALTRPLMPSYHSSLLFCNFRLSKRVDGNVA